MADSRSFVEIMLAQNALQQRGFYHGPIDGNLSKSVRQALMDFQKVDGLDVTGELDERLFHRLLALRQEMVYSTDETQSIAYNGKSSFFAQIAEYFRSAFGADTT